MHVLHHTLAWTVPPAKVTSTGRVAFLSCARFSYLTASFGFFGVVPADLGVSLEASFFGVFLALPFVGVAFVGVFCCDVS